MSAGLMSLICAIVFLTLLVDSIRVIVAIIGGCTGIYAVNGLDLTGGMKENAGNLFSLGAPAQSVPAAGERDAGFHASKAAADVRRFRALTKERHEANELGGLRLDGFCVDVNTTHVLSAK